MNTSPPSKRTKLDPLPSASPSPDDTELNDDADSLEQEHCTICLQPFLDRTIIPVCAHEFCFECILLWSEQSRKCPLCSRSFDNSYLIHHVRSQYDYQKHYLPPLRSSPPPPLTGESHANALRNMRRERQWGRRQRRQREETDQLERAIARRRWIYQHHLYAKHVASNPYTRYRPFPTSAQFAASPDLISRMTIFLRRELRVWPNLDVEFLTTYTISLMKSIDIRSESAVKLLSEFLDLDTSYTAGARHVNAEHFAHEIYSYLRSPYRDLNMYDQTAQYETPPEISPPQEIERGSRWSAELSPSRRSHSRSNWPPIHHRENIPTPAIHGRDNSAEAHREGRPSRRHSLDRSSRSILPGREDHDSRNHLDRVEHILCNGKVSYPEASSSAALIENQDNNFPVQPHSRSDERGKGRATESMGELVPVTDTPKLSSPGGDDSATALTVGEPGLARLVDGPLEVIGDEDADYDYVDKVRGGSSANPQSSRKRSASGAHVHPRNRTLSESVQAYLSKPAAPRHPTNRPSVSGNERPARASETDTTSRSETDARPRLLLRLTDGPTGPDTGNSTSPRKTTANGDPSTSNDDRASEQQHHGYRSQPCPSTAAKHPNTIIQRGDQKGKTRSRRFLPSAEEEAFASSSAADRSPGWLGFPPVPTVTPLTRNANVALSHPLGVVGSLVDGRPESVQTGHGESRGRGHGFHMEMEPTRDAGDQARPGDGVLDLHSDVLGRCAAVSLDDHEHGHEHDGDCDDDPTGVIAGAPSVLGGDDIGGREVAKSAVGGLGDVVSEENATSGSGSGSMPTSTSTSASTTVSMSRESSQSKSTDVDPSVLEARLRTRAHLQVRLAAMKGTVGDGAMGSASGSDSGGVLGLGTG